MGFSLAIIWLGFFGSIPTSLFFYYRARTKERLAIIEKGGDVKYPEPSNIKFGFRLFFWRIGMMVFFGGLCLILSYMFPHVDKIIYPATMIMGAGLGLILSYFFERFVKNNDQ
jgi:hypothetical protein